MIKMAHKLDLCFCFFPRQKSKQLRRYNAVLSPTLPRRIRLLTTYKTVSFSFQTLTSYATHNWKLKELAAVRSKLSSSDSDESSSIRRFAPVFFKTLAPLFVAAQRRTAAAERIVRFVAEFACLHSNSDGGDSECDEFLDEFLKFLISGSVAANRNTRFRVCQIISEIILWLPDEVEVADELWDDVIDCMMLRVRDKVLVYYND